MRIEDLLFDNRYAKKTFTCVDENGEWNYQQLVERCRAVRNSLVGRKFEKNTRIAVACENSSSFIIAFMGILYADCIAVMIDPQLPLYAMKDIIRKAGVKAVMASGKRPNEKFADAADYIIADEVDVLCEERGDWDFSPIVDVTYINDRSENDIAFLFSTSGTAGNSKIAAVTHKAILNNLESILDYMKPTELEVIYTIKTMVHLHTLGSEILVALSAGAKLIALNPLIPISIMLRKISFYKSTILVTNSTLLNLMCQKQYNEIDFNSLNTIYLGGSLVKDNVWSAASKTFTKAKVLNSYGLTEAGNVAGQLRDSYQKPGSVGIPMKDIEVVIKSPDGHLCMAGESGDVYVKTKGAMLQYWNEPELTKNKLVNNYVNTGDFGYIDEDGEVFILGRTDDVFVSGAHNINPNKVEAVLRNYNESLNCLVFGSEDELLGMKVVCVIEDNNMEISEKSILKYCTEHLAYYECPHVIHVWKELPKTLTGKISRQKAKEIYQKMV